MNIFSTVDDISHKRTKHTSPVDKSIKSSSILSWATDLGFGFGVPQAPNTEKDPACTLYHLIIL